MRRENSRKIKKISKQIKKKQNNKMKIINLSQIKKLFKKIKKKFDTYKF